MGPMLGLVWTWPLLVGALGAPPTIECDPAAVEEREPDCGYPVDSVDGGCFSDPHVWFPVECGQTICGTSRYTWGAGADLDVYEVLIPELTTITWRAVAEFPFAIHIVNGSAGCYGQLLARATGLEGQGAEASASVYPGLYWLSVLPDSDYSFACGAKYQATLTCESATSGACCVEDGRCEILPPLSCGSEGGAYLGDGTTCAETVCPNGPGACCTADGACTDAVTQMSCEGLAAVYYGGGSLCAQITCIYPEPPFTREGEPICYDGYVDDFNGGCDPPEAYPIHAYVYCPSRFVGYSGSYLAPDGSPRRDMDLFLVNTAPETPHTLYHWRVTPAFPAQIGFGFTTDVWFDPCNWHIEATATAQPYHTAVVDIGFTEPGGDGMWFFYVRPQAGAEVPDGAPYIAELTSEPLEDPACAFQLRGDANCDALVNVFDIDAFVVALAQGESSWEAAYGGPMPWPPFHDCGYMCVNDCNGDGAVNVFDIDPFVRILVGY
jgi:hypothetical protein